MIPKRVLNGVDAMVAKGSAVSSAKGRISGALSWWGGELVACIPAVVRDHLLPARTTLFIEIQKEGVLRLSRRTAHQNEVVLSVQPQQERTTGETEKIQNLVHSVDSIVLSLPDSCGVRRRVTLPAVAAENLREVLSIEMDRLTPFTVDDIYFTHSAPELNRAKDQISVMLTIVPKNLADDVLKLANGLGIYPDILTLGDEASPAQNLFGETPISVSYLPPFLAHSFAVAVVALIVTLGLVPLQKQSTTIANLEHEIALASASGNDTSNVQSTLAAWRNGRAHIVNFRSQHLAAIEVIDHLSSSVADDSWLNEIEYSTSPNRLTISGYSKNAPGLITTLESIDAFRDIKFDEPVAFDERLKHDRFRVSGVIVAQKRGSQ